MKNVTVYCASSNLVDARYTGVADEVGRLLAEQGYTLVYGGGDIGLMGAMARSVHANGGSVVGVIPEALKAKEGVAYDVADEMIVTATMRERKGLMYGRADAFLVLPGGFGTVEEFMEVLTLKQLRYHNLPIVLVNTDGFFDPLLAFFDHLYRARFAPERYRGIYHVAATPADAFAYLKAYRPTPLADKWS